MRTGLNRKMVTREKFKAKVDIIYYRDSTKITNSYLLTKQEIERVAEIIDYSRHYMYSWKCKYLRNTRSYVLEITGNNRLYRIGLFKRKTRHTVLLEKESIISKIIYWLIGR